MNRKIIVSGCANCPYLTVYNDGEDKGHDSICRGECGHPSYHRELLRPYSPSTVFLRYTIEDISGERLEDSEVFATKPAGIPDWCPLPNDTP